jgi:hypothetical protein
MGANRFNADPIWLLIIAPPSNAKTELLRAFDGDKDAYFISSLTPATLVSGIPAKGNKPDPSLLPKLSDKLLILKDFTSVLSMRSENQQEILAQLRECYDGNYYKMFGNGKEVKWSGRFNLLGACTPVYDAHYAVIGSMGERFLLYRTNTRNGYEMALKAQEMVGYEDEMRKEISTSLLRFLSQFDNVSLGDFKSDEDVTKSIIALSCFCSFGRCPVKRDYRNQCVTYEPEVEGPARIVKQLTQLGIALALVNGKNGIDESIYRIIKKIGRDLLPTQRLRIIKHLWDSRTIEYLSGWEKTTDIADKLNMPSTTALIVLEDLMTVRMLKRRRGESEGGRPPYMWQLTSQFCEYIGGAEVFDE